MQLHRPRPRPIVRSRIRHAPLVAVALAALAGCDRPLPTASAPDDAPGAAAPAVKNASADRPRLERLARRFARAMANPSFRAYVAAELDQSPFVEHKVHLQRFLHKANGRALRDLARLNQEPETLITADAATTVPLEVYFPVPDHRSAWRGGDDLLVATTIADRDTPVAFDVRGQRHTLSPDTPPTRPVLAVVPAETNFDSPGLSALVTCGNMRMVAAACGSTTPPSSTTTSPSTTTSSISGLYMSKAHLRGTFESWLKGAPEIEILVLGQKGATDSLTKYQCIGQRASGSYYFDQDGTDWSGNVLLFSQTQLDNYKLQHPGQAVRLFFMEDDDTSCELRNNNTSVQNLIGTVDGLTRGLSGGRDSTTSLLQRLYKYAVAAQKAYTVVASFINSNDDMIGNAVESVVTGEYYTGYNWVLKGEGGQTNGYINLQMR